MAEAPRMPIESGCPDPIQYMHPTMRRNYGQWAYHDHPRPGVLLRAGVPRAGAVLPVPRGRRLRWWLPTQLAEQEQQGSGAQLFSQGLELELLEDCGFKQATVACI